VRGLALVCALALAACGKSGETRRAANCLDYQVPEGWVSQPLANGDISIVNPKTGTHGVRESFVIRFVPGDRSLDETREQLVRLTSGKTTNEVADRFQKKAGSHGPKVVIEDLPPPEVTPFPVDGHDGFRISGSSVMSVQGASIEMIQVTVYTKFGTDIVAASAGYAKGREAVVKPLSDAFLASLRFSSRCR
jgi:hypothetical protein